MRASPPGSSSTDVKATRVLIRKRAGPWPAPFSYSRLETPAVRPLQRQAAPKMSAESVARVPRASVLRVGSFVSWFLYWKLS